MHALQDELARSLTQHDRRGKEPLLLRRRLRSLFRRRGRAAASQAARRITERVGTEAAKPELRVFVRECRSAPRRWPAPCRRGPPGPPSPTRWARSSARTAARSGSTSSASRASSRSTSRAARSRHPLQRVAREEIPRRRTAARRRCADRLPAHTRQRVDHSALTGSRTRPPGMFTGLKIPAAPSP